MPERSTALVITGMHRSATSLAASAFELMGVEIGRDLVPPDRRNPKGYFEDIDFLELQRRILRECSPVDDGGHVDWGWTPSERLDLGPVGKFREEARRLADSRAARFRYWAWKDPRTTLLLDFWDGILDDARYLLLYRFPWEVADSMQRTGEEVFLRHPEWAHRIWSFYNRRLVEFYRRNADRCLLVSANSLPAGFSRIAILVREKLGLALPETPSVDPYESGLFRTGDLADPIVHLTAAASPDSIRLLEQLDELADVPAPGGWRSSRDSTLRFASTAGTAGEHPVALSIVIPCYNDRDFLLDAVASVERHALDGSELILVNDGSTEPRTLQILRSLRLLGYAVVDQENAGLSAARNTGVRVARGRYVLPLDADNRIRPGFLEAAVTCLESRPEVGVVYGDRELFGWRSGRVRVAEFDLETMLRSNYIDACAVYRREVWNDSGGYDTNLTGLEDWDFWIGAAKHGWRFHHLGEAAFDYRVRPGSLVEESLRPKVLERLLSHIHRKHEEVFRANLPRPLRWVRGPAARAASVAFWRSSWFFRSRAWRRYRRELGRPPSRSPERS
jgi:glycosyltransferase involved in cell wall biosynthesis